jgi:hypothetical protein
MNSKKVATRTIADPFTGYSHNSLNFGKQIKATLDDVRIYDVAFTTEEVQRIYTESKDKYLVDLK